MSNPRRPGVFFHFFFYYRWIDICRADRWTQSGPGRKIVWIAHSGPGSSSLKGKRHARKKKVKGPLRRLSRRTGLALRRQEMDLRAKPAKVSIGVFLLSGALLRHISDAGPPHVHRILRAPFLLGPGERHLAGEKVPRERVAVIIGNRMYTHRSDANGRANGPSRPRSPARLCLCGEH